MKLSIQESLDKMRGLMAVPEETMLQEALDAYTGEEVKRAYVSIKITRSTFSELKNGVLKGVRGVSTSKYNVSEWFIFRDALIVMPFDQFAAMNNVEQIDYSDPDYLMRNNMAAFYRLYDKKNGDDKYTEESVKNTAGEKIAREMILLQSAMRGENELKDRNMYDVMRYLDPYNTSVFYKWLATQEVSSPRQYAEKILEFWPMYRDRYYPDQLALTVDDLEETVRDGIRRAGEIYQDESEWLVTDLTLRVPDGAQIIFKRDRYNSDMQKGLGLEQMIAYYNLGYKYKIYFTNSRSVEKYQAAKWNEKAKKGEARYNQMKEDLQLKHQQVLADMFQQIAQMAWKGVETRFPEWEQYYEYYINDPEGESERVYEPYIYHPAFQRRWQEVVAVMKGAWDAYFTPERTPEQMGEYTFSSVYFDMRGAVEELMRAKREGEESEIASANYNNIDLYRFYRMCYEAVDDDIKYDALRVMYKKMMGKDLYRVLGTRDVKI